MERNATACGGPLNIKGRIIVNTEGIKEAIWLKGLITELGIKQKPMILHCDSQVHLSKHQIFHERSKHTDVKLHFVKYIIEKGDIKLEKFRTKDNPADVMTKVLPQTKFKHCLNLVRVLERN